MSQSALPAGSLPDATQISGFVDGHAQQFRVIHAVGVESVSWTCAKVDAPGDDSHLDSEPCAVSVDLWSPLLEPKPFLLFVVLSREPMCAFSSH